MDLISKEIIQILEIIKILEKYPMDNQSEMGYMGDKLKEAINRQRDWEEQIR